MQCLHLAYKYLQCRVAAARDPDTNAYFIDRSPKYFESILNFLRTGEIECPCCLDLKFLLQEAEYYGLEGKIIHLWGIDNCSDA